MVSFIRPSRHKFWAHQSVDLPHARRQILSSRQGLFKVLYTDAAEVAVEAVPSIEDINVIENIGPSDIQYPTHRHHTPYSAVIIDKSVPRSGSPAKYRAPFSGYHVPFRCVLPAPVVSGSCSWFSVNSGHAVRRYQA